MKPVPIVYDDSIKKYSFPGTHPFKGSRFEKFIRYLKESKLVKEDLCKIIGFIGPPPSEEELQLVHSPFYVRRVAEMSRSGIGLLSIDTPVFKGAYEAFLSILHSTLSAYRAIASGEAEVAVGIGGGLHHAGRSYGEGFCIFNDVAIVAKYAQKEGFKKIFIFDYDAHQGNGTMDIFYSDPTVFYLSIHQDPLTLYPGTGFVEQVGVGEGEGYTCNIPLPPGAGRSCYERAIKEVFLPLVECFKPDLIICNGGSDPHYNDPLTMLSLDLKGFWLIGRSIREAADVAGAPAIDLIASGYDEEILPRAWTCIIAGIVSFEEEPCSEPPRELPEAASAFENTLREVKQVMKR
ncbi:MAG: acetoin utilization protein AcuC, partial [Thermoproteota archaeon]